VIVQDILKDNLNVYEFLKENSVTIISHTRSTYSSDVALNGFYLFPVLKMVLKEGR
jgi:hypothetical protein